MEKIRGKIKLLKDYNKFLDLESKYIIKKVCGKTPTSLEEEGHKKFKKYSETLDKFPIPEWYDGVCYGMLKAIKTHNSFDDWEKEMIIKKSKRDGMFSSSDDAENFIRLLRAKRYLVVATFEFEKLKKTENFRRIELLRVMEKLKKLIDNKVGIPKTGMKRIEKLVKWEENEYSKSINWNKVIKVPRMQ